jgi:hypothetical protein
MMFAYYGLQSKDAKPKTCFLNPRQQLVPAQLERDYIVLVPC